MRRALLVLGLLLATACSVVQDAAGDLTDGKPEDKPEPVPLTLPPAGPPTSEFQTSPPDPVRDYCAAVEAVAAAVAAGGIGAAAPALDQVAAASEGLAAVAPDLSPADVQTVTSCTSALQDALNPG